MIMMHDKILHGLDGIPFDALFSFHHTATRSNGYKLYKNFCHLNCRKYFFSQQIINDWNNLPREVIKSDNVLTFNLNLIYTGNNIDFLMYS